MRKRILFGLLAAAIVGGGTFALANTINGTGNFTSANVNALAEGAADVCDVSVTDIAWNVAYDTTDNRFNATGADLDAPSTTACSVALNDMDEAHLVLLDESGSELLDSPFFVTDDDPTDGLSFSWPTNTTDVTVQSVSRAVLIVFNDDVA